jgi:hypothetical protein
MITRYSFTSPNPPWSTRLVSGYYRQASAVACRRSAGSSLGIAARQKSGQPR